MSSYWHLTTDFLLGEFWSCCIDVWTWSSFWRTYLCPPLELQLDSPLRPAKAPPAFRIVTKVVQRSQWASLGQYAWRSPDFRATSAFTKFVPDSLILHPAAFIKNYFRLVLTHHANLTNPESLSRHRSNVLGKHFWMGSGSYSCHQDVEVHPTTPNGRHSRRSKIFHRNSDLIWWPLASCGIRFFQFFLFDCCAGDLKQSCISVTM